MAPTQLHPAHTLCLAVFRHPVPPRPPRPVCALPCSHARSRGNPCMQIPAKKQQIIAESMDRTPGEILKKLEDIRNRVL